MSRATSRFNLILILLAFLLIVASAAAGVEASSSQSLQRIPSPAGSPAGLASTSTFQYSRQTGNNFRISMVNSPLTDFSYNFAYFAFALVAIILSLVYRRNRSTKKILNPYIHNRRGDKVLVAIATIYLAAIALGVFLLSKVPLAEFNGLSLGKIDWSLAEVSIMAILFLSILIGSLILIRRRLSRIHQPEETSSAGATEELRQIFERAVRALSGEAGYRSSIIECYKQVLEYFKRRGMPQRANLSPREF